MSGFSPLIDRLISRQGYPVLAVDDVDPFLEQHEYSVLFFSEDPKNFPESNDVAVILPELMEAFGHRIAPAIIARGSERPLQARYRFKGFPALVFFRYGGYLDAITKVRNWGEYIEEISTILKSEVREPPAFDLSSVCPSMSGQGG